MKKFNRLVLLMLAASLMIFNVGCVAIRRKNRDRLVEEKKEIGEDLDELQIKIRDMTLDQKIGQLMILGFEEKRLDESLEKRIRELKPGGLILFKRNVVNTSQMVSLLNDIKTYNKSIDNLPIFISTDEEGGQVSRMPDDIRSNPAVSEIGKLSDLELVEGFAGHIGSTLSRLGVNMNNGPVLDIRYNPNNDVTRTRTFGDNKEIVAKYGLISVEEYKKENILSVVKHFPGHGSTDVDSHYNLPIVTKTKEELMNEDIYPFKLAIENGVDAIMVSHILYRNIDNKPASISKKVINDLLIEELAFKNLIISDDMTMGAITNSYEPERAAVEFLKAGGDLVLFCHGDTIGYEFQTQVKDEIKKGYILEEEIDKKVYKILKMKDKYGLDDQKKSMPNILRINSELEELENHENIKKENQKIEGE